MSSRPLRVLSLFPLLFPLGATARVIEGVLDETDSTLDSGEFFEIHEFQGRAGSQALVSLTSDEFDPYLIVLGPGGLKEENDDWKSQRNTARIELELPTTGNYRVMATTYKAGESGRFELVVPDSPPPPPNLEPTRTVEGRLELGDGRLSEGEYMDRYDFVGEQGQTVAIDLRSNDFDPYLILRTPTESTFESTDFEGAQDRAYLEVDLPESGDYAVMVTSDSSGETGSYRVTFPDPEAASTAAEKRYTSVRTGTLAEGDATLDSGEFLDNYYFEGESGQSVVIDLTSEDFDPYLILFMPSGEQLENDDWEGNSRQSRLELELPESGRFRVAVTSYKPDETGAYTLELPSGEADSATPSRSGEPAVRTETGRLEKGDATLESGEFVDEFQVRGAAGEHLVVDLRSTAFDPYLMIRGPGDFQQDNDDHEGSAQWSRLDLDLPAEGEYRVLVTTYKAGSTGDYELVVTRRDSGTQENTAWEREGALAEGDNRLDGGEFVDQYPLELFPGARVEIDLTSPDFDPYLVLRAPSGETVFNDDWEGSAARSRIEHEAAEAGEYTVFVTSYAAAESGTYTLAVETSTTESAAGDAPASDLSVITFGETQSGQLAQGDLTLDAGEFADVYAFEGTRGESIAVDLTADAFDTYLVVMTPDGQSIQNDDFEGSERHSRIELPLEQDGRYRIVATSYAAAETGTYTVSLERVRPDAALAAHDASGGEIYGVFVGISDYGGRANNLSYTDEDARRVFEAVCAGTGMPSSHGTLLLNAEATRGDFEEALARIARIATPRDTVVLFFSGHGGRYDRPGGYDHSDPDGKDETLEFFDTALLDDELNELLGTIDAGTQLIVVDACFSGGFAKDIISEPGRMGLFSSEEDVTSAVAAKFRAGGYLSFFFADSLREPYADADEDGQLTALELSHYISERYRAQVKSGSGADWVSTSQNLGYQKLVVDRGSIRPYDAVFRRR